MEDLISTLLMLARTETNGFQKEQVNVADIILVCYEQSSSVYADKKLNIQLELDHEVEVSCHKGSLERIMQNLIDNACKYSSEAGSIVVTLDKD